MTLAQQLQVQRFNASVKYRGVSVKLYPAGPLFTALVQTVVAESAEFTISKETRNFSRVFILQSDIDAANLPAPGIGVGSVLVNQTTGETYRVTTFDDNAADVRNTYHCETSAGA